MGKCDEPSSTGEVFYRAQAQPTAIVFGDSSQTWAELNAMTDALARGLAARGVGKGDRVGVMMLNRPELAHVIIATMKLGAISVPLNFRLIGLELAPLLVDSAPGVVIVENSLPSCWTKASIRSRSRSSP